MNKIYDKVKECYKQVNEMTEFKPQIALVLGSGLGDYAEKIKIETVIDYHEIKGFPVSTVQGHKGRFVLGYVEDIPVMIMEGRVHYYEGYSMSDVVLPIRLMKMMGAEILFLTNASGGIHRGFEAGDFMMITDQIASFVPSPLIGPNIEEFGERFPDMSHIYDEELQEVIRKSADYLPKMIELAGGSYIFDDLGDEEEATSTVSLQMEEFYAGAKDADYIIYNSTIEGELSSLQDLLAKSPLLEKFKAVKEGHVYCTTKNLYQSTMELGTITSDIRKMLTGDDADLTYLYKVE